VEPFYIIEAQLCYVPIAIALKDRGNAPRPPHFVCQPATQRRSRRRLDANAKRANGDTSETGNGAAEPRIGERRHRNSPMRFAAGASLREPPDPTAVPLGPRYAQSTKA